MRWCAIDTEVGMSRKSMVFAALMFVVDFFSALFKELKKRGVTEETIFDAMKSKDDFIPKMAEAIAALIAKKTKRALVHLKLAAGRTAVSTAPFSSADFLDSRLGVKVYLWDNFKSWISIKISRVVPAFTDTLTLYTLSKSMYDAEIRAEIGEDQVFSVDEFVAAIKGLTAQQASGEAGALLVNGYANIFYVRLDENTLVAVVAYWDAGDRVWFLAARHLECGRWDAGSQAFGRS